MAERVGIPVHHLHVDAEGTVGFTAYWAQVKFHRRVGLEMGLEMWPEVE